MTKFFVRRIIDGKCTFSEVPRLLKDSVHEMLIEMERQDLIIE